MKSGEMNRRRSFILYKNGATHLRVTDTMRLPSPSLCFHWIPIRHSESIRFIRQNSSIAEANPLLPFRVQKSPRFVRSSFHKPEATHQIVKDLSLRCRFCNCLHRSQMWYLVICLARIASSLLAACMDSGVLCHRGRGRGPMILQI